MEFFVYSRGAIERVAPHDVPHAIISITSTPDDVARLPGTESCRGVLRLAFLDVDAAPGGDDTGLFSRDQARAVCDFIDMHRAHLVRLIVHCDAGISRSPAIAAGIAVCLGQSDEEFFRRYQPNRRVYRMVIDEWRRRRG
jgi:predicted protein tyrosine phosphatase